MGHVSLILSLGEGSPLGMGAAWLVSLGVLGALACAAWRDRRGLRIACVRWAAVLGLLVILVVAPMRAGDAPDESARPSVVLLVDTSESMSIRDESLGDRACSRWDAIARTWLDPDSVSRVREVADVRFVGVDSRTRGRALPELLSSGATGEQTRLARGVRTVLSALADRRGEGRGGARELVVITDGIDTDGESVGALGEEALSGEVRVHGVVPGSDRGLPDVSVVLTASADVVYAGQSADLVARIRQTGFDGRTARLVVREGGADGRVVHDGTVMLERSTSVWVPVTPEQSGDGAGGVSLVEYVATIEALEGEQDESNNVRRTFVRVTDERIRVCVFEARPYWDTKFFVQSLRNDPQIELTVIHALGSELVRGERAPRMHVVRYVPDALASYEELLDEAPLDADALREYDVVVLGKGIDLFFPSMEAETLTRFVTDQGGSVVFLRGAPIESNEPGAARAREILSGVSPVSWGRGMLPGGRLELTDEGKRQRALQFEHLASTEEALADLPGVIATSVIEDEKALSVVWLRQVGSVGSGEDGARPAAIAHMSVGRGRTLAVLSDGMWRWAFLPASLGEHSSVYQAFWSRAVRWLALGGDFLPGQSVSLDVDRLTARPGQGVTAIVRTRFVDMERFRPRLTVRAPGGDARSVVLSASALSPSKMTGVVIPDEEGVHEVELIVESDDGSEPDVLTTRFAVYDDRVELLDTASRAEEVRALCEATGGRMLGLDGVGELADLLEDERAASMTMREPVPAWDSGWVFALLVGMLGVEWIVRRRGGLA